MNIYALDIERGHIIYTLHIYIYIEHS